MSDYHTDSTKAKAMPETALAPRIVLGTLEATTPEQLLAGAHAIAKPLADLIERQRLYSLINGRRYVRVEGWTTLGAMLGVVAREVDNLEVEGHYIAKVQLVRLNDGQVITSASAECGRGEPVWEKRPHYARRSMAATRATGKACRLAFSWVMTLAGFEATPAEEMDGIVEVALVPMPAPTSATASTTVKRGDLRISEKQQKRLFAIAKSAGWSTEDVKHVVEREAGVSSTSDIKVGQGRGEYDALCKVFEAGRAAYDIKASVAETLGADELDPDGYALDKEF